MLPYISLSYLRNVCRFFITGGEIKASTEAIVGAECVLTLKNYNFTKCFMGTNGISLTAGFTLSLIHIYASRTVKRSLLLGSVADG